MRYEQYNSRLAHFCQAKTEHRQWVHMFRSVRLAGHNNRVNSNSVFLSYPTLVFKNDSLQN